MKSVVKKKRLQAFGKAIYMTQGGEEYEWEELPSSLRAQFIGDAKELLNDSSLYEIYLEALVNSGTLREIDGDSITDCLPQGQHKARIAGDWYDKDKE